MTTKKTTKLIKMLDEANKYTLKPKSNRKRLLTGKKKRKAR